MSGTSRGRWERLLRVRRAGESAERGRLARARQDHSERAGEAKALSARVNEVTEDVRALGRGELDLARLKLAGECRDALGRGADKADGQARAAERRVDERRGALGRAHREARAIGKIAERGAIAEKARLSAAERREGDDRPRTERP